MRSPAVILNPTACGGKALRRWQDFLSSDIARVLFLEEALVYTGEPSRLGAWVRGQYAMGQRNFVAAGGDGTVNLAVNALMQLDASDVALGAVGLGSSNDFHKPNELRGRARVGEAPTRLAFDQAFAHDVGEVKSGGETAHFIINASVGITAEANAFFNEAGPWFRTLKRVSVNAAILVAALRELAFYRNFPVEVQVDEAEARTVDVTNFGIVKNPHFSGSFRYDVPQAADDGRFGVHLCESMSKPNALRTLVALSNGKFNGLRGTSSHQASQVRVRSERSFALETDGEVRRVKEATLKALGKRLQICP